jgi:hypothetical protein
LNNNLKNEILLIDNSMDIDLINFNSKFKEIITLDYLSHEKLKNKKIVHTESDVFVSESEFDKLVKLSYSFVNWHDNPIIKNLITYRDINLGKLFYGEFYAYLLPVLKLFSEISEIGNKYNESLFHVSSKISKYLKNLNLNFKELKNENQLDESYINNINYELKFKKKSLKIQLTPSHFKSIKKISENIFELFFNKKYNPSKKTHVFIEFDTTRFKELFLTFPKSSNFILYNRRRPYIWNPTSFSILKNSNAFFINEKTLLTKEKFLKTNNWLTKTIDALKESEKIFYNFFSINNKSFWKIIRESFFSLCDFKFKELIFEIDLAIRFIETVKPSTITVMYEIGIIEQILISIAKKHKITINLLQHGIYYDDNLATEENYFSGVLPKTSDYFFIWGDSMNSYCKNIGISNSKIKKIGNPAFDNILNSYSNLKSEYILLAAQAPTDFSLYDLRNSTYTKYLETIKEICHIAKKLKKKLIIKLHPDPHELDLTKYVKNINPNVEVIKFDNIYSLIQNCELFIAIDVSTTILQAQILKKPVISISVKDYKVGDINTQIFQYCLKSNIKNLEQNISKLYDQDFKNSVIEIGNKSVKNSITNFDSSSKKFISTLENF